MACPTGWNESIANKPPIYVFLSLQLLGGSGMLVILITASINPRVNRRSTWYSFCLSWIISSISYCILFLAGQQFNCRPSYGLCLTQTALIYAAPILTAATTLSLAIHMLLNFEYITTETPFDTNVTSLTLLLLLPYCIWIVLVIGVLCYGIENTETVQRLASGPYCSSTTATWSTITFVVVGILSVALISTQALLAFRMYKGRQIFRQACGHASATLLRIMIFVVLGSLMLCTAAGYTFMENNKRGPFDIILSLFPVLATVIFGSQTDILKSWKFWKLTPQDFQKRFSFRPYSYVPTTDRYELDAWEISGQTRQYSIIGDGTYVRRTHLPGLST